MLINFIKPDFEFKDDRGCLIQLCHDGWKQVNFIQSEGGVLRGNHYHKNNIEAFYVISGSFKLTLQNISGGDKEFYEIRSGEFFTIGPDILHSFEFIEPTLLVSMYDKGVEEGETKDIYNL